MFGIMKKRKKDGDMTGECGQKREQKTWWAG